MAEPTTFPEEHVSAPVVYRRLSGFAITSLALAVFFAFLMVLHVFWGLREHTPVLLNTLEFAIPVVGALLALVALYLIRNSEGTLAGAKLALWGWWLSAVVALGYLAYYGATYFAVNQQADTFATDWLNQLKEGKYGVAFLECQEPALRKQINPANEDRLNEIFLNMAGKPQDTVMLSPLMGFRTNAIVHAIEQGGEKLELKSAGAQEWSFKDGGYHVRRMYTLTTEEAVYDIGLMLVGRESQKREYEGRQWQVSMPESHLSDPRRTQLGMRVAALRALVGGFLEDWGARVTQGNVVSAYGDTLDPSERKSFYFKSAALLMLSGLGSGAIPQYGVPAGPLAGCWPMTQFKLTCDLQNNEVYKLFCQQGFLKKDKMLFSDAPSKPIILENLDILFGATRRMPQLVQITPQVDNARQLWTIKNNVLSLPVDCRVNIINRGGANYVVEATVTVELDADALQTGRTNSLRLVRFDSYSGIDSKAAKGRPPAPPPPPRPEQK